jgi:hypothetical protein
MGFPSAAALVPHGWLTPAAPGCTSNLRCEMRNLRCTVEHGTRAAGVSPPWVCKPRMQRQRQRGEFPCFELACRVHSTGEMRATGGLRPPLLCCGAKVCRRKTIFAMHIRTSGKSGGREPAVGSVQTRLPCTANDVRTLTTAEPRAAGVSPPWVWLGECNPRCAANSLASALHKPRLASVSG